MKRVILTLGLIVGLNSFQLCFAQILVDVGKPQPASKIETEEFELVPLGTRVTYLLHETNRGHYSDGAYKSQSPEFIFVIDIFENNESTIKEMTWTHIAKFGDKKFKKVGAKFETRIKDVPAFFAPTKSKRRKPTSVFVGQTGTSTIESFMITDEYFEYSKMGMGSVHLSSGKLIRVDWNRIDKISDRKRSGLILPSDTQKALDSYLIDFPKKKNTLKLNATRRIILENESGFSTAFTASPESKTFVQSLLRQIIDYEKEIESSKENK